MAKILSSFKAGGRAVLAPIGGLLLRVGLTPDAVTVLGTVGVIVGACLVAAGHLVTAVFVTTFSALIDVIDGSMAKMRGGATRFGALLDSAMDRVADGAIFAGLTWWLLSTDQWVAALLSLICLVAGQVVSYVKARAESLGFSCDVGIAERLERLVIAGFGALLTGLGVTWALTAALWVLAVLSVITAAQRILHVRAQDRRDRTEPADGSASVEDGSASVEDGV